ncbi:hypothetical protein pb186bvf_007010, partial [Paramecium bursaria]
MNQKLNLSLNCHYQRCSHKYINIKQQNGFFIQIKIVQLQQFKLMASQREQIFENKNFSSEVLGYKNTLNRNERKSVQDPNDCFTISQAETSNSDQFHEFIDLRIESAYQGNKAQVNQQGKEMNSGHLVLKKYVLNNQIEKIPSAREKMKPKTIQNNLLEYALKVRHTLEINVNKLIEEVNNLEDQTFDPLKIRFEYHPNYLAIQCLEQIEQLNLFIDENLKLINQVNGNEEIIQFYCCEEVKILEQFQDFQDQRFELKEQYILDYGSDENYAHEEISAFQQSPNQILLACCQYKTITIWNLLQNIKINEITHQRFIQSITFYDDSNNFIIGDDKGVITKFTSYCKKSQPSLSYQVHQASIIQMIIKLKDQIYSCSTDNSIRLSDLSQNKILLIINNCFGCQSGFEYSQKEKVIIAPNNKQQLILWDEISGKELANSNLQIQETEFISICLSDAQDKILVNLFKE